MTGVRLAYWRFFTEEERALAGRVITELARDRAADPEDRRLLFRAQLRAGRLYRRRMKELRSADPPGWGREER